MGDLSRQRRYWDTTGATKVFTHPVNPSWLADVREDARILDYGCGYGRVTAELAGRGFTDVSGVDISAALIARGRRARPDLDLTVIESPPALTHPAGSFDVILLLAVLTCIPEDEAQHALVAELHRLLTPGGSIHVSDLVLQPDERNVRRYAEFARQHNAPYGVFATDDGAVCRHHDAAHLRALFAGFDLVDERHVDVATMNGRRAAALQMLVRKR